MISQTGLGRTKRVQAIYTASGVWTAPAAMVTGEVEAVIVSGGGRGDTLADSIVHNGSRIVRVFNATRGSNYPVVVGAGGTVAGNVGGTSSFNGVSAPVDMQRRKMPDVESGLIEGYGRGIYGQNGAPGVVILTWEEWANG